MNQNQEKAKRELEVMAKGFELIYDISGMLATALELTEGPAQVRAEVLEVAKWSRALGEDMRCAITAAVAEVEAEETFLAGLKRELETAFGGEVDIVIIQ